MGHNNSLDTIPILRELMWAMLIFNLHQICTFKLVWATITKFLEIDVGEYFVLFYFQCHVTVLF